MKRYERPAVASAEIARTPDGGLAMCLTDLKPGEGKLIETDAKINRKK